MEFYDFPIILGISSSQLTLKIHDFSEGVGFNHQPASAPISGEDTPSTPHWAKRCYAIWMVKCCTLWSQYLDEMFSRFGAPGHLCSDILLFSTIYIYIYIYIDILFYLACLCQRGENRACSRAEFFNCCMFLWGFGWGGGGVGGWGGGGDVNVHWTCTLTWCYATARSLQFTQRRDATLLHVLFNLHNDVMLRYCTFSSIYTLMRCYATARSLQFTQLRDATLTGVGGWGGVITSMLTPSWSLRL